MELDKEADVELITREKPDAVILAAGAIPIHPGIPGIEGENVIYAADVLEDKADVGGKVVVIGGGAVGIETALFVANKGTISAEAAVFLATGGAMDAEAAIELAQKGKQVTILEMLDKIGQDMGITTLSSLRLHLRQHDVEVITQAKVERINESGVEYTKDNQSIFTSAHTIIIAVGSKPECQLAEKLQGIVPEVHQVGDCVSARTVREAIEEAARIGRQI